MSLEWEGIRLLRKKEICTCLSDNSIWVKNLHFALTTLSGTRICSHTLRRPVPFTKKLPPGKSPMVWFPYNRPDRLQGPNISKICPGGRGAHMGDPDDRRDRNHNRWHRTWTYISASFNIMAQIVYDRDERVDIYVYKGNQAQRRKPRVDHLQHTQIAVLFFKWIYPNDCTCGQAQYACVLGRVSNKDSNINVKRQYS